MRTLEEINIIKEYILEQKASINKEMDSYSTMAKNAGLPNYIINIFVAKLVERDALLHNLLRTVLEERNQLNKNR